ncbi:hypothetical protein [Acidianus manzaensis]|uniref:PH domain-containing protein n=1 Tax=Acidianus manzaensis TaxID=282676 RepID=A0A1W6K2V1_9CREN|nr:hypothetical protein [Acidianus manzaensis]ARM76849.1 hypothetical protein B6F84_13020 [Acidianus manzaensis]
MNVIIKSGASLKKISIYTISDILVFIISIYLVTILGNSIVLDVIFDISFFLMILFFILLFLVIKKGSIIVTDTGIYIRKIRKYHIPWNKVKNADIKATRFTYSPFSNKYIVNYAIEIFTDNKTYEVEVPKASEVLEKIKQILENNNKIN